MSPELKEQIRQALQHYPQIQLAIMFGSMAQGTENSHSDLDLAVLANRPLDVETKIAMIAELALVTGRAVDLVDVKTAGEPLLGELLSKGRRILGSDAQYGDLLARHLLDAADFLPYRNRILKERRQAWIGA